MRIRGIPQTKYQCFVLWRKVHIPRSAPGLPPKSAERNSVRSRMRRAPLCFALAFALMGFVNAHESEGPEVYRRQVTGEQGKGGAGQDE